MSTSMEAENDNSSSKLTFNLVVAYMTLGIIAFIGLPLFIICVWKFYKRYNETFFIRRHRILILVSTILFSSFLLIEQPFYQILMISHDGDLDAVNHEYILYSSFFKSFYYANAFIYSLRVWLLYFDYKYHDDLRKYQWRIVLHEKYSNEIESWFIQNRDRWGCPSILYKIAFLSWLIVTLIHLDIQLLTINTNYFFLSIWGFLLFIIALCVIFMAIIWRKFPINDEFCIKAELKRFILAYCFISGFSILVIIIIVIINFVDDTPYKRWLFGNKNIDISAIMFLMSVLLHITGIYSNTWLPIRLMQRKSEISFAKQENDGIFVKQLFQQFENLSLQKILKSNQGFNAFMNHLCNEFSSEHLLFAVEV